MPAHDRGIDPRAPRVGAAITSLLLLVTIVLALTGPATARSDVAAFGWFAYQPLPETMLAPGGFVLPTVPIAARVLDPAFLLLSLIALLFLWGVLSPRTAPYGVLFRRVIGPRLAAPDQWEDPRPPRFAQGVGLAVSLVGLILQVAGVPWGLPIAAAAAFVAAFLNAAFGFCLGCQMYLLLQRTGLIGRPSRA